MRIDYVKENIMNQKELLKNVCRDFLYEKIAQRIKKNLNGQIKSVSVGHETEESLRNALSEIWKYDCIKSESMGIAASLSFDDFLKAGLPDKKSYKQVARGWGQCDLVFYKNGAPVLYGEIKTTTSALTNTCHLINVAVTSLRVFNKPLINIVLYPDKDPNKLMGDYQFYVNKLFDEDIINDKEKELLDSNFYILTNQVFDKKNGIKGKLGQLTKSNLKTFGGYDEIIAELNLLNEEDINYNEWDRLIEYLNRF